MPFSMYKYWSESIKCWMKNLSIYFVVWLYFPCLSFFQDILLSMLYMHVFCYWYYSSPWGVYLNDFSGFSVLFFISVNIEHLRLPWTLACTLVPGIMCCMLCNQVYLHEPYMRDDGDKGWMRKHWKLKWMRETHSNMYKFYWIWFLDWMSNYMCMLWVFDRISSHVLCFRFIRVWVLCIYFTNFS